MELADALKGARIVMEDKARGLTLAWFGGHGVHVYDRTGREVSLWHAGDFSKPDADAADIKASMEEAIRTGDYPSVL